ncbi:MAG: hypothetical protein AB1861_02485 [Cyanobacteriota bacterium]
MSPEPSQPRYYAYGSLYNVQTSTEIHLHLGTKGRLVLPSVLRNQLEFKQSDRLLCAIAEAPYKLLSKDVSFLEPLSYELLSCNIFYIAGGVSCCNMNSVCKTYPNFTTQDPPVQL